MADHPLFADRWRDDPSPADEGEPVSAFLDRVDDPAFDRVRRLLNAWFAKYPERDRWDLRRRLASTDDTAFYAAWFEMYLHAVHRGIGFDIVVHPNLEGVTSRPDFLLSNDGDRMLIEATVIGTRDGAGRAGRVARIVAAVNRVRNDDFALLFDIERQGPDSPPMRGVRGRLEHWLASLSWEDVRGGQERRVGIEALPSRIERVGDWQFSFRAWPRRPADRGRAGPAIWAGPAHGAVWEHSGVLLDRLEEKATKYGTPPEPVVLAVGMDRLGARADDVSTALFGPTIGSARPGKPATVVATSRRGDEFFATVSARCGIDTSPACYTSAPRCVHGASRARPRCSGCTRTLTTHSLTTCLGGASN